MRTHQCTLTHASLIHMCTTLCEYVIYVQIPYTELHDSINGIFSCGVCGLWTLKHLLNHIKNLVLGHLKGEVVIHLKDIYKYNVPTSVHAVDAQCRAHAYSYITNHTAETHTAQKTVCYCLNSTIIHSRLICQHSSTVCMNAIWLLLVSNQSFYRLIAG